VEPTLAIVQGTRPEIIKNYAVVKALRQRDASFVVLDTGQHQNDAMSNSIYRELGYEPTYRLDSPYQIGSVIDWLRDRYSTLGITQVVVNGDTAASISGALAALYKDIDVAHIEAGLRARDDLMIEERNRIMVDAIASDLFAYTAVEHHYLRENPDIRGRVHLVGNTTVDLLHEFADRLVDRPIANPYFFATMHRKEFTDSTDRMRLVFAVLDDLSHQIASVVFPIHPRTVDCAARAGIDLQDYPGIQFCEPFGIFDSLAHQKHALVVITDSGCIQEEAYLLRTQCVTVRNSTERQLTLRHQANELTGFCKESIANAVRSAITRHSEWPPIYGTPGVGNQIVDILLTKATEKVAAA
jgi:UDP-N-acetylglucosamine 2-epimerase (non-hydrolysing)